ncbi:MAG: RNA-binding domain-containing protein, partial [Candidatus Bathyarchaeia archaeon]
MNKNEGTQLLISQIEVAVFAHSTENADKVKKAVKNLLLKPVPADFKITHLKGHYGNPIRLITLTVSNPSQAYELFVGIVSRLDEMCKEHLERT